MAKIPLLAARLFQLLAAAVVLGLSAKLYKDIGIGKDICDALDEKCDFNGLQPAVGYCAFVGAWGLLDVIVGSVGVFVDAVPWLVTLGVDGLAAVFYLAGGIVSSAEPSRASPNGDLDGLTDKYRDSPSSSAPSPARRATRTATS